jgi:predicted transcriptional regulator
MMTQHDQVHSFKLDQRGLGRVFGELEAEIMAAVWSLGEPTVGDVCDRLGAEANYKTVMTVMNRLVQKGVLVRQRAGRAFVYTAAEGQDAFMERVSRRVFEGLLQDFGAVAVVQFMDAVDAVDPALLVSLERLVRERSAGEVPS